MAPYVSHLLNYIDLKKIKPIKLVVNAGNGCAGQALDAIESTLKKKNVPITFIKIHHKADGQFPNGIPNPLLPENRSDTSNAVIKHQADMGIAWDGDFDRCFLFDESGRFIEGYYIVALLAEAFLEKSPNEKIVHDPRLTWNTIDVVKKNKGIPIQSKTGHAYIKEIMRKEDAIYGGEMSAHHYFRDFAYCDSGMIPWLLITELVSVKKQAVSQLVGEYIQNYPSSGEINKKIVDPESVIAKVEKKYSQHAIVIDRTDGISMEFEKWRFNLRISNTEAVTRLNVETRNDASLMKQKTEEIINFIS